MQLQERILQLMKNNSDVLALTYTEFSHIRNVITRAELENLLFNEKLYSDVAQGKLCFTCRKVHFNLLTFTFGIQCNVCKQKVCRNCVKQIALPKERLNDLPIQTVTPLTFTKSLLNSDRCHSLDAQSPTTPTINNASMNIDNDVGASRRLSIPNHVQKQHHVDYGSRTEPTDLCTDCFFLLRQIREKFRQHHVSSTILKNSTTSRSSSCTRSCHSSSRSASNYNLSTSSSASSVAALLTQHHQQRSLMVKASSTYSNLKYTKSSQELLRNNETLKTLVNNNVNTDDSNEKQYILFPSSSMSFFRLSATLLCLVGIGLSSYAFYIETRKSYDPSYQAACDISERMSCSRVLTSRWGRSFGLFKSDSPFNIPDSLLGLIYYCFSIILNRSHRSKTIAFLRVILSIIVNLGSIYLICILYFILHDLCMVCCGMYVVNFIILICNLKLYKITSTSEHYEQKKR